MADKDLRSEIQSLITNYKSILNQYKSILQEELLVNKDIWSERYTTILTHLTKENFDTYISLAEKNLPIIKNIENQYDLLLVQLSTEEKQNPHYIQLVFQELSNEGNLNQLRNEINQINNALPRLQKDEFDFNAKQSGVHAVHAMLTGHKEELKKILDSLIQLKAFEYFKNSDKNVVIIGANGSGKSSFARKTRKVLGDNITIIAAQKIFSFQNLKSIPVGDNLKKQVWQYQSEDKLAKNSDFYRQANGDLQNLISYLIQEQYQTESQFFENYDSTANSPKPVSLLDKVIDLWQKMLPHRKIKHSKGQIFVYTDNSEKYDFMSLSDGEKAVFYYIAHVLSAKPTSFIIVDEPENHLHLSIISKLWNTLESVRTDCRFIYLTHNLDFAASRNNVEKLWMKKFEAPANWDLQRLPENDEIPEMIYMEILGSRKQILFCEGKKNSIDYKLYSILFPEFTIIPVGGHINVINYTKAFNASANTHNNSAIGIIDGDFHTTEEKMAWKHEHIFSLDVQEIENLLCDDLLLEAAKNQFCADDDCIERAKTELFKHIEQTLETQAIEYATMQANYHFSHNLLEKAKTIDSLESSYKNAVGNINIKEIYEERKYLLQKIIDQQDFQQAIKKCNSKGMFATVYKHIEKENNRLFIMLANNPELQKQLLEKYFSEIIEILDHTRTNIP